MPVGYALKKRSACKDKLCVRPDHWSLDENFSSPMHILSLEKRRDRLKKELAAVEIKLALYQRREIKCCDQCGYGYQGSMGSVCTCCRK